MSSAPAEDGETVCGVSSDGSDESEDVEEGDVVVVVEEEGFDEPTELFKFDGGPRFNGLYQRKVDGHQERMCIWRLTETSLKNRSWYLKKKVE